MKQTLLALVLLAATACGTHLKDGAGGSDGSGGNFGGGDTVASTVANFASVRDNIINTKCLNCHKPGNAKGDVDLHDHASILSTPGLVVAGNPGASLLYQVVEDGSMPRRAAKLNENELKLVRDWITGGATVD